MIKGKAMAIWGRLSAKQHALLQCVKKLTVIETESTWLGHGGDGFEVTIVRTKEY